MHIAVTTIFQMSLQWSVDGEFGFQANIKAAVNEICITEEYYSQCCNGAAWPGSAYVFFLF